MRAHARVCIHNIKHAHTSACKSMLQSVCMNVSCAVHLLPYCRTQCSYSHPPPPKLPPLPPPPPPPALPAFVSARLTCKMEPGSEGVATKQNNKASRHFRSKSYRQDVSNQWIFVQLPLCFEQVAAGGWWMDLAKQRRSSVPLNSLLLNHDTADAAEKGSS